MLFSGRSAFIFLPATKSTRIDDQTMGQFFLSEAKKSARSNHFLSGSLGLKRVRDIAKEFDNLREAVQGWGCPVVFPIVDGGCTGTKPFGNLFLEKL